MKEKVFNIIIILISLFFLLELFISRSIINSSVIYALKLWVNTLIPSLFPFFIISDILINYNIINYIPKCIKDFLKKLFNINDNMLTILILSMMSGFPSNARNTRIMYDKRYITLEEANHILIFTHFANPIFILTTVAVFFLHNKKVGYLLLGTHYLSNFILGIVFRGNNKYIDTDNNNINNNTTFGEVLVLAIKRAIDTILTISGIITIFLILASIIINTFNITGYTKMIIKGFFEITIGIEELSNLLLSNRYMTIITSMFLAFGGISVHMQVLSQIADTKIKYIYFFIGRMYQLLLAGILTYLSCIIFGI